MGPVFAFCETGTNNALMIGSIDGGMPPTEPPRARAAPRGFGSVGLWREVDRDEIAGAPDGIRMDLRHLEHRRGRGGRRLIAAGPLRRLMRRRGLDLDFSA